MNLIGILKSIEISVSWIAAKKVKRRDVSEWIGKQNRYVRKIRRNLTLSMKNSTFLFWNI